MTVSLQKNKDEGCKANASRMIFLIRVIFLLKKLLKTLIHRVLENEIRFQSA